MVHLEQWGWQQPQMLDFADRLYRAGFSCALISGVVAVAYGARPHTSDVDLFTPPGEFWRLQEFIPDATVTTDNQVTMVDRYGVPMTFQTNEMVVQLGSTQVQIVQPLSPVVIAGYEYDLSHTKLVTSKLNLCNILGRSVLMTDPLDTILMKILFQRGRGKSDIPDAVALAPHCRPNDPYLHARATEIGYRAREFHTLESLALGVRRRSKELALAA